jgi:lantibiotic biosynthesis protein
LSSSGSSSWQPLLNGALRQRAERAIEEICAALEPTELNLQEGPDLLAQYALLHAYLRVVAGDEEHERAATRFLDASIDRLAEAPIRPALHGGFTGIAWVVEHLQHPPFTAGGEATLESEDPNSDIDAAVLSYLSSPTWKEAFDLIVGLVGLGVYALERLSRPSAVACLERVLDHLAGLARSSEGDVTWWTPPELIPRLNRDPQETGHYNLGVSHGVPGVIAFLAQATIASDFGAKIEPMLAGAVSWLLKQQLPKGMGSRFAHVIGGNHQPRPSRAAWCYGDPGIAVALLSAAQSTKSADWECQAIEIGINASRRNPAQCGVIDPGLCHGATGLAHVYNRLFQATRNREFADASIFWFDRALEMRRSGQGVAGFAAYFPNPDPFVQWHGDRDFLTGAVGMALSLLAASSSIEPLWDRLLLTSVRPKPI